MLVGALPGRRPSFTWPRSKRSRCQFPVRQKKKQSCLMHLVWDRGSPQGNPCCRGRYCSIQPQSRFRPARSNRADRERHFTCIKAVFLRERKERGQDPEAQPHRATVPRHPINLVAAGRIQRDTCLMHLVLHQQFKGPGAAALLRSRGHDQAILEPIQAGLAQSACRIFRAGACCPSALYQSITTL